MPVRIIAIAPYDGWAFISKEDGTFLLRPPYTSSNLIESSMEDVENAVLKHDFEECEVSLENISGAVKYLKNVYMEKKREQGIGVPSDERLKEIWKYASDDILLKYLNKAKDELIPKGQYNAAESFAQDLRSLESVQKNPDMMKMVSDILGECCKRKSRLKEIEMETGDREEKLRRKFPYASNKYTMAFLIKYQKVVSGRKQLFAIVQ